MAGRASNGIRKIQLQYLKAEKADHPNLLFLPDETDMHVCYVMVVGLGYPSRGGEFILQITMPPEFPDLPPKVVALSGNGAYTTNSIICISIGEFHSKDRSKDGSHGWRKTFGLIGFARECCNGIICPEGLNLSKHPDSGRGGLGIEDLSEADRQIYADNSRAENTAKYPELRARFLSYAEAHPKMKAARAWLMQLARVDIDGPTDSKKFRTAFGSDLDDWCETNLPTFGCPGVHLKLAGQLKHVDRAQFQRAYLAAFSYSAPEATSAHRKSAWAELVTHIPTLAPRESRVARLSSENQRKILLDLVKAAMLTDFEKRDQLLAHLG